jgi:amino acid adenylation domain-containing protein
MTSGQMLQDRLATLTPAQRAVIEKQLQSLQQEQPVPAAPAHLPFPMTDIQQAYWAGRTSDFAFGKVATHAYAEIDATGLDLERLNNAWNALVARHDMLRAIFLQDGTQRVLNEVPPYHIAITDLRLLAQQTSEISLSNQRLEMSHQSLPTDRWPLFDIRASLLESDRIRLHLSFDAITTDLSSRRILFREWGELYHNNALPPLTATFQDYALAEQSRKSTPPYARAKTYWLARALPAAPEIPLHKRYDHHAPPVFARRSRRLSTEHSQALNHLAKTFSVSLNILLLIAYADVLRLWSRHANFTLNLTLFNRPPSHAGIVGDFTSLTMLEIDTPGDATLATRAAQLQNRLWRDLDHRQFSGVEILRDIARQREGTGPIMPFVFTSADEADLSWVGEEIYSVSQTPQVWLDLMVLRSGEDLVIHWNAVEALFPAGQMEDMFLAFTQYLDHLANRALDGTSNWRSIAQTLLPQKVTQLQTAANATAGPEPTRLLHQPWKEYAAAWPNHPAVISPTHTLTHGQLANIATTFGHRLRGQGVRPNMLVAVVMHKGWEQIAAVLAILESGGAYLPLDPDLPTARLHYLLADADINIVLTQPVLNHLAWPSNIDCITLTPEDLTAPPGVPLEPLQSLSDLAYVIYTSGSSGQPKGVAIDHRGAANTVEDINARFNIGPKDRMLALSALTFDLSVYDIFGVLGAGGALVLPAPSGQRDPAHWAALIRHHKITLWNSVPALMELLVDYERHQHNLRLILLSGDRIPTTLPTGIQTIAPGAKIISLGGATEASIWSIFHEISEPQPDCPTIPYGKPLRNQTFHILAPGNIPCPLLAPGELHIGGIGLAVCYWGDPTKTAAAFILDAATGERLYRTGDRGRYLPDGSIEFLGREDHQVKLHGFRIELAEPESALAAHPAVKEAVVIACDGSLAGFIVPHAAYTPTPAELTQYLRTCLPGYMVPTRLTIISALPLTPNGKIDRRQLSPATEPAPQPASSSCNPHIEQLVHQSCRINIPTTDANFLDLGLNSIDIIRIVNALDAQLGFRPSIESLYAAPTIKYLTSLYAAWCAQTGAPQQIAQKPEHRPHNAAPIALPASNFANQRRTIRRFTLRPIQPEHLSTLLSAVQPQYGNHPYASASSLYPVQTYLYTKPGRIFGIPPGPHFYDPSTHALHPLAPKQRLHRSAFNHYNAPIFDEAGFALLLVAEMRIIEPIYAERSLHLATLEAGLMTQTFERTAASCGLGLCQVGSIDTAAAQDIFRFSPTQKILHIILGGYPDSSPLPPDTTEEARLKRLLQRVKQLSADDTRALLGGHE